jgi:SPP1 family predicted phage head-tail adaptor
MMDVRKLRHRVELQQPIDTIDTSGEKDVVWTKVSSAATDGNYWCAIQPYSTRELLNADKLIAQTDTRIVMRSNTFVDATMRLIHGDTTFNIMGIQPDPDSGLEWMTLVCRSSKGMGSE